MPKKTDSEPLARDQKKRACDVFVVLGPGGVGKTTVCAALALALGQQGRKVLALTIDPAWRLMDSLGIDEEASDPVRLSRERLQAAGFSGELDVSALVLDAKRTFDGLVERYASSDQARRRIIENPWYEHLSRYVAGVHEYMAIERLFALTESGQFDTIVLDTPPAEHALTFLDSPQRLLGALDHSALSWILKAFDKQRGLRFGLLTKGVATLVGTLSRLTGATLLEGVARLAADLNDLFGGFQTRAQIMSSKLRNPAYAYVLVSTPDALSLARLAELRRELASRGLASRGIVLNRLAQLPPEATRESLEIKLAGQPQVSDPESLADSVMRAIAAQQSRVEAQSRHLGAVAGTLPILCRLPEAAHECADLGDLKPLAELLTSVPELGGASIH